MVKHTKKQHARRNRWGAVVLPSRAYKEFKELREGGYGIEHNQTWAQYCTAYRKKLRKKKMAKYSRKGSNKRIKRVR